MQENGRWVTINGTHVYIKDGQSIMDAFIRSKIATSKNMKQEEIKKNIVDVVNNGQVFEMSAGPTMTICSRYENGDYTWLNSSGDSPMGFFDIDIVPHLKDEFVVVEKGDTKIPRYSRFKKYGYEKIGEIKATDMDTMEGKYTENERTSDWVDKWVLMKKVRR